MDSLEALYGFLGKICIATWYRTLQDLECILSESYTHNAINEVWFQPVTKSSEISSTVRWENPYQGIGHAMIVLKIFHVG